MKKNFKVCRSSYRYATDLTASFFGEYQSGHWSVILLLILGGGKHSSQIHLKRSWQIKIFWCVWFLNHCSEIFAKCFAMKLVRSIQGCYALKLNYGFICTFFQYLQPRQFWKN